MRILLSSFDLTIGGQSGLPVYLSNSIVTHPENTQENVEDKDEYFC